MIVTATAKGFYVGERAPGDVFEFPDSLLKTVKGKPVMPSWFRVATDAEAAKVVSAEERERRKKDTFSGLASAPGTNAASLFGGTQEALAKKGAAGAKPKAATSETEGDL